MIGLLNPDKLSPEAIVSRLNSEGIVSSLFRTPLVGCPKKNPANYSIYEHASEHIEIILSQSYEDSFYSNKLDLPIGEITSKTKSLNELSLTKLKIEFFDPLYLKDELFLPPFKIVIQMSENKSKNISAFRREDYLSRNCLSALKHASFYKKTDLSSKIPTEWFC